MKFLPSQLAYLTTDREARSNLRALVKYLAFLAALVSVYAVLFHVIKVNVEHEQHSSRGRSGTVLGAGTAVSRGAAAARVWGRVADRAQRCRVEAGVKT